MPDITVFSKSKSPRLTYVLDWVFRDVFQCSYSITTDEEDIHGLPFYISYGRRDLKGLNIPDAGLLSQEGVPKQEVVTGEWIKIPTLFHVGNDTDIPFDIFSAVFFLLSRYEEYYDFTPDKHNRYPSTDSILYKNGWLHRPLVDEWLMELYTILKDRVPAISLRPFSFQPTYDIDIAFSYKHKGLVRTAGAFAKAIVKLDLANVKERGEVLAGSKQDPFDCFPWMQQLHTRCAVKPIYFVLASLKATPFDKNISPLHPKMQELINGFGKEGKVGLHPSYYSIEPEVFQKERKVMEKTSGGTIFWSRQHYIRLRIPQTYRTLIDHGITDDWSMGYGSALGFRAGTGRPFPWYDLEEEKTTQLTIHPFCFMDSTAHYEQKLSASNAFTQLEKMKEWLERTQSKLVTVFHNFSLGSDKEWNDWREHYEAFLLNTYKRKVPK